jgi:PilZ domain
VGKKRLMLTFGDGKRFLRNYSEGAAQEELFLPGVTKIEAGEQVELAINFQDSGYSFKTSAQVIKRRLAGDDDRDRAELEVGSLVAFIQSHGQRQLLAHARGETIDYKQREDPRIACSFPVKLCHRSQQGLGEAVDLSPSGIQLMGTPELQVGDVLELRLYPPDALLGLKLLGQVKWIQRQPEPACGISLSPESGLARRRLNKLYLRMLTNSSERDGEEED